MSAEAREAVARALAKAVCDDYCGIPNPPCHDCVERQLDQADAIFAALRPVIAAEIREYAKQAYEAWEGVESYATDAVQAELDDLALSADEIADRITTTGEQQ